MHLMTWLSINYFRTHITQKSISPSPSKCKACSLVPELDLIACLSLYVEYDSYSLHCTM